MAVTVADLQARLSADTSQYDRDLSHAEGRTSRFGEIAKRTLLAAGAAIAAGMGTAAVFSVKAASDLGEQINKTGVVFGENAKDVHSWSRNLTRSFGLSQRAALEAAGTYGNMLKPMGLAPNLVSTMSKKMTELAGDMASFNNASPAETLDALRAGLAGETEPLRRFGIFLNDARLKEEAMRMGLYKGTGALDAAAKAQATYSLILKDSADTQGDFARTGNSLPNLMRTFKGELENAAASLGQVLLPVATKLLSWVVDIIPPLMEFVGIIRDKIVGAFKDFASGGGNALGEVKGGFDAVLDFVREELVPWFRQNLLPIWNEMRDIVMDAFRRIGAVLREHRPQLMSIWENLKSILGAVATVFREVLLPIIRFVLTEVLPVAVGIAIKAIEGITGIIRFVIERFRDTRDVATNVFDWIKDKVGDVRDVFDGVIDKIRSMIQWIKDIPEKLKDAFGWLIGKAGKVAGFFGKGDLELPTGPRGGGIIGVGRWLQSLGYHVAEHPAFGGVSAGSHTPGSFHYQGRAIDVNWPNPSQEPAMLDRILPLLKALNPLELLWRTAGHDDHLHLAMARGGYIGEPVFGIGRSGASYSFGERGGEYVIPRGAGGATYNIDLRGASFLTSARETQRLLAEMVEANRGRIVRMSTGTT